MARLIYLMGPSGAGKDCLLSALRNATPQNRVVAHRYITRPADAGAENHVALSKQEFIQRAEQGLFALHWQAHQHCYAIGIEINLWLQHGLDVLVNGSRAYLPEAQRRYRHQLLPLCLTVSPAILAQRLRQRGRENSEQIDARLQRAQHYQQQLPSHCLQLCNDGELQHTLSQLQQLLTLGTPLSDPVEDKPCN
ncbi:ribose 1,5-bisphosphokinase [Yersinia pseudotuberculosis]|uniref:ribose 1,5-bisphosphokinase n=1 Tax=Yersinia pseudotuberculosis TaxID=633 RepID=UPI000346D68F|nr:ribose 1,5-bisphosphokinase [Yersinia pseudotuberculosis]QES97004.1 ribose 1,5-bisphosphokinase [Yersinia pseudotuberculosis]CFU82668.1 ribose 1%2C5-bisphosphokinase [Yersinia pseudotuberculosis]CNA98330.1 ribose 1%2C5-bisphosphokinase [Yersinia pseudotuberculosis]CNB32439.1 ribose 1%2C5-bisphosphokinase [Yersinia pseudotuberculosis]CRY57470.1 ribose 1%2C5-bisphosphokinase [Yersinia pseudotuberculosis]